ncbi:hypothetical protein DL766_006867 [Monosporascus sp. MC13-8B]|uniref:Uncharacterized protein n=1 Tax=Monosporascus cannonballus TaxID=155416 RepID=A0ABY0GWX6_9PEZI|nr:hypothetical protein DL762_008173 [Monosporascus cannonballus]RYO82694.1 hypothetical protein DL763_008149 [Monosporascus cannonballus]RYP25985.1 hypothetical protein DL766_006867 [Monosporascus sp. MC13-8B]
MGPTIDIVRHAEAFHNIMGGGVRDPSLTPRGKMQCQNLALQFPYRDRVAHVVASPMRRTIETALLGLGAVLAQGKKITPLPELQEVNSSPSSTGSPADTLRAEYGDAVDLSRLDNDWYRKGSNTEFTPNPAKVEARARRARVWLRELAHTVAADAHIVVVTHGEFVHWLADDFAGVSVRSNTGWYNAEFRSYEFANRDGGDTEAALIETATSRERRGRTASLRNPSNNAESKNTAALRVRQYAVIAEELEWEDVQDDAEADQ